ncbi:MAG: DUF86 domain-containing protein [bacterium]|nr:DUF86 domain-containing protein [bacterium]
MPRDARAYLSDIIEACDAITAALLGEAVSALSRVTPDAFASITRARRIVDFRNQLTHEYPTVDDALVWAIADRDVPVLRVECSALMRSMEAGGEAD